MKRIFLTLFLVVVGFLMVSCQETTTTTTTIAQIQLVDVSGKTQSEIETIYQGININLQFRTAASTTVSAGQFIRYIGNQAGDFVLPGSTVRVEIAILSPTAPVISGGEDTQVLVSVQGNPPTFDLWEGLSAVDYLGNAITPNGNFFYILHVKDSLGNILPNGVDYYRLGNYTVTYVAQNSGFMTEHERVISIIVPPFDTNHTDNLRLTESYVGKSFINDGIGVVTVSTYTDADTTNFRDSVTGTRFTVRYLGIDAPEATSKYDPWGIKAGNFVRDVLSEAQTIILQAEPGGNRQDGNGRYLAWVWYIKDGVTRLLNLELVEEAYAWAAGASSTQYGTIFTIAAAETQLTGRRIYGEVDPDYDYSTGGTPVDIGYLIENFDAYIGKKATITGVITAKVSSSFYIEQNGKGIYIYAGFGLTNEIQVGYEVTIQGLVAAKHNEGKQLTNYFAYNMQLLSTDNEVTITTINGSQMSQYVGRVVRLNHLRIVSVSVTTTVGRKDFTVVLADTFGNTVNIRVEDSVANFVFPHQFVVGSYVDVFGPVTQFLSGYQLMLPGTGNITFK